MLSVLANKKELGGVQLPDRRLNIALSTRPPLRGVKVDRAVKDAVVRVGEALQREGHRVIADDPPYNASARTSAIVRWLAGALDDLDLVERSELEPRTRRHLRAGELALRFHLLRDAQAERWHRRVMPMFERYDVVLMPTLARVSLDVGPWSERSWLRNVWAALNFAPFTGLWNFAPFPAASVPAGIHQGVPEGVQLVAGPGGESTILSLAKHIENISPWRRHASL
jgi:amidase